MDAFKIYQSDFGITVGGVNYEFDHVLSFNVEDPRRKKLTRGANKKDNVGLTFEEGIRDASTVTVALLGVSPELFEVLCTAFEEETRCGVWGIDRGTGSAKMASNAILSRKPQQLNIDDSADSMTVELLFESYDVKEKRKA